MRVVFIFGVVVRVSNGPLVSSPRRELLLLLDVDDVAVEMDTCTAGVVGCSGTVLAVILFSPSRYPFGGPVLLAVVFMSSCSFVDSVVRDMGVSVVLLLLIGTVVVSSK